MIAIRHQGEVIVDQVLKANSIWDRLLGLMFRSKPPQGSQGLLLEPCNSIHTFFMRYSLDVVFLNSKNEVIKVIRDLKPWRMTWIYFKASKTLELPSGKLLANVKVGDVLEVLDV